MASKFLVPHVLEHFMQGFQKKFFRSGLRLCVELAKGCVGFLKYVAYREERTSGCWHLNAECTTVGRWDCRFPSAVVVHFFGLRIGFCTSKMAYLSVEGSPST